MSKYEGTCRRISWENGTAIWIGVHEDKPTISFKPHTTVRQGQAFAVVLDEETLDDLIDMLLIAKQRLAADSGPIA